MAIRMTGLSRAPNGDWFARKSIPKDVRDSYRAAFGNAWEEKFRLPGSTPVQEAKQHFREWDADITSRIEAVRSRRHGTGIDLSHRERVALCGKWYQWFLAQYDAEPGTALQWNLLRDQWAGVYSQWGVSQEDFDDPEWEAPPVIRRQVRATLSTLAEVPAFLASSQIQLSEQANDLFLEALEPDFIAALNTLIRRCSGDYRPDPKLLTYPEFKPPQAASGFTVWSLFENWIKEKQPRPQTIDRWRAVFVNLQNEFKGVDPASITEDQARSWAKGCVTEERSALTVVEVWLNAARTIFGWAVEQRHCPSNPFKTVKIPVPKVARNRETKAFLNDEISKILGATLTAPEGRLAAHYKAARRWIPWLCAYTGARVGEMAQLRREDIMERDGIWAIKLTPEAGAIKNGEARSVPIHEHLIAQGFLDFVQKHKKGPLFYDADGKRKEGPVDPTNPGRALWQKTGDHLGTWVRSLGVTDVELRPNHAWRHTFKQVADRAGISERVSDTITGHAPVNIARQYGQPTLVDMATALEKFPRYRIDP